MKNSTTKHVDNAKYIRTHNDQDDTMIGCIVGGIIIFTMMVCFIICSIILILIIS